MRAKFGRGPTVVSKKGSLKFISRSDKFRESFDHTPNIALSYTVIYNNITGVRHLELSEATIDTFYFRCLQGS